MKIAIALATYNARRMAKTWSILGFPRFLPNDDELAETVRLMRNFRFNGYDNVIHPGTNGKMPEINAAMGLVNLDVVPGFVKANMACYESYANALSEIDGVRLLGYDKETNPNYQHVVLEIDASFKVGPG